MAQTDHYPGFTIIETMIVIVIMAILSIVSFNLYSRHQGRASFVASLQETNAYVIDAAKNMGMSSSVSGTCSASGSYTKTFPPPNRIQTLLMYGYTTPATGTTPGKVGCIFKAVISSTEADGLANRVIQIQIASSGQTYFGKRCFSSVDSDYLTKDCIHVDSIPLSTTPPL